MAKREDNRPQKEEKDDLIRKLVSVNRVTKVVKGGRHMRFSALVVVGDGKGKVGIGTGKAGEVPEAIEKAVSQGKRNMTSIALVGTTIPHKVIGKFSRGMVLMLPAEDGAGVIAGGPVRAIMEACGIKNIRTKSYGSNNPFNCVRATMQGLLSLRDAEAVAKARGKTVEEILN